MATPTAASSPPSAIADRVIRRRAHGVSARQFVAAAAGLLDEITSTADSLISIRGGANVDFRSICRINDFVVVDKALTRC